MPDPATVISLAAAAVSAVATLFAALAAFRSAASAREAQEAAQTTAKRAALRALTLTANEVLVEAIRAESRGADLKLSYRTLFAFGGSSGGSTEDLYVAEVDKKLAGVATLSEPAKPFAADQEDLMNGPLDAISSRETMMAQILRRVRALREDLEREHAFVEGQCAVYLDRALRKAVTR